MKDVEIIGMLKSFVKKTIASITVTTVSVSQNVTAGNELAEISVNDTPTKVYMPSVTINGGDAQTVENNALNLDVASNLIPNDVWGTINSILS